MNKHFTGKTCEMTGSYVPPEYIKALGIPERIEPKSDAMSDMNRLRTHMKTGFYGATLGRLPFVVSPSSGLLRTPFGSTVSPGLGMVVPIQGGGHGHHSIGYIQGKYGKLFGADLILEIYKENLRAMKNKNKILSDEDDKGILEKINFLRGLEMDLFKILKYIEEYNYLIDCLKDYTQQPSLSISNLEALVKHYGGLLDSHSKEEMGIMAILQSIHKTLHGKMNDDGRYTQMNIEV